MNKKEILEYISKAKEIRKMAYAPYSKFKVGALIIFKDGTLISGANVENASYGLTICAERSALFKMSNEGKNKEDVLALLVIGDTEDVLTPCGACRGVMSELLLPNTEIICANMKDKYKIFKLKDLIPNSFSGDVLNAK
ncbi:MAG: cytidine deaminase [Acholeplasmatales bacterium]|jgi:cytidine deaminase|nr:cytidine deaminase [Acholeplasmatales bacterium]